MLTRQCLESLRIVVYAIDKNKFRELKKVLDDKKDKHGRRYKKFRNEAERQIKDLTHRLGDLSELSHPTIIRLTNDKFKDTKGKVVPTIGAGLINDGANRGYWNLYVNSALYLTRCLLDFLKKYDRESYSLIYKEQQDLEKEYLGLVKVLPTKKS